MKRPSYRAAIEWIAHNDSASDDGNLDPSTVGELVSSALVADLFGATTEKVGRDVVAYRTKNADEYPWWQP